MRKFSFWKTKENKIHQVRAECFWLMHRHRFEVEKGGFRRTPLMYLTAQVLSIQVLLFLLFAGIIEAITVPANIDKAKIDSVENLVSGPHYPFVPRSTIIVMDSSTGEYTMWTQIQECLAYNPGLGYLQFVCRNFVVGGYLDVYQNDNQFSGELVDVNVYTQQLGPARYPTSVASDDGSGNGPHIAFPYSIGSQWGGMGAQYESGGWYSSSWNPPVDVGTGDLNTHKNIGKQLPDGNILFIGPGADTNIDWSTYTPDLSARLAGGVVAPAPSYYWGFDINGGIAYLFYYDLSLNVYYKTTTDGITWDGPFTWEVVWPAPYTSNIIFWNQAVVTDAGMPILIFDNINGDDQGGGNATYPWRGKVYVSIASGAPCIEVGNTAPDARNFYPTIASEGNYVVALFLGHRSGNQLNTFWDIYYNYSTDSGTSWQATPICLTADITEHTNSLPQIAKRLDTSIPNGRLFFAFGHYISYPFDDPLYNIMFSGPPSPCRWYAGYSPVEIGIAENKTERPKKMGLNISPNPVARGSVLSYTLPASSSVSVKLYRADGRLVRIIENGNRSAGTYTVKLDSSDLANGTYFVVLDTGKDKVSGSLVIVH